VSGEIDHLWALRDLDEQVVVVRTELKRFPELRATIQRAVAEKTAALDRHKGDAASNLSKRRELEREIEALTTQERKFQSQTATVKKNEEYRALLDEIEGVKRKRSDLETEVLMAFDSDERFTRERTTAEQALKAAQAEAAERTRQIEAEERVANERLAALDAERATHVQALPPASRSRYERIRQSREGRAVVAIQKGACGGCFRAQPPQLLQDARRRDRLLVCENCGRLLIWPPDAA
jgi:predicted  nucleic acid-binding Zn-ribbon protein